MGAKHIQSLDSPEDRFAMDTRFIKTLLSVVDTGSFASAARSENLTAAAVAQRVRSLEAELNEALIVRAGQRVVPTAACLSALSGLRRICDGVGQIEADLQSDGLGGDLRLGSVSTALSDRLPAVIARFSREAPHVKLHINPGTSEELYAKLNRAEIDAAFILRPPFRLPKALGVVHIETQSFVVIAHNDETRAAAELFASERALIYDTNSWGGKLIKPWLQKTIPAANILCEVDALEAIASAVGRGLGYSIVPRWAGLSAYDNIKQISLPDIEISRDLLLVHRNLRPAQVELLCA